MKFSFRNSPEWFTNYVTETYVDEFHEKVKSIGIERLDDDHATIENFGLTWMKTKRPLCWYYNGLELY